jgi:pimeloyl-ACP methyl ester carboxylesterase
VPWLDDVGQAAFYRQIAEADEAYTDQIEPLYPAIDIPVLVMWGRDDAWIPVEHAHRLHDLIPGARLLVIEQAGHLIQLDQPAALSVALTQWLSSIE